MECVRGLRVLAGIAGAPVCVYNRDLARGALTTVHASPFVPLSNP